MADKEIIDLPAVEISDLPTAESVADDILLPCYVPGSTDPAQKVSGKQLKDAIPGVLPAVSEDDEGKVLGVVGGKWVAVEATTAPVYDNTVEVV